MHAANGESGEYMAAEDAAGVQHHRRQHGAGGKRVRELGDRFIGDGKEEDVASEMRLLQRGGRGPQGARKLDGLAAGCGVRAGDDFLYLKTLRVEEICKAAGKRSGTDE